MKNIFKKSCPNFLFLFLSFFCYLCIENIHAAETKKIEDPLCVYLTWQHHPESTMVINWITSLDGHENTLNYKLNEETNWREVLGSHVQLPNKTPYFLHRLELENLEPETFYQFRIGTDSSVYKFKTMPMKLNHTIRFVAGGDMYHDDMKTLHETNIQAAKTSPSFGLVGGDIAYASSRINDLLPHWIQPWADHFVGQKFDRWLEWLVAWSHDMITPDGCLIPIIPAIGNHDTIGRYGQTPEQAPFFYALFPMPGVPGFNVLDFSGYMSIFILDSGHTNFIGGKQADWLANAMEARQNVPHKFALYHVPAYPSIHRFSKEVGAQIRKFWVPSFDKYHLTAAFENHEHAYKRTHRLSDGTISSDGVVYIGDGGWGVKKPRRPRRITDKSYLANVASARHFIVVDIEKGKQTIQAVNSDGQVIDSYSWQ